MTPRILLIEDDESLRRASVLMLERLGMEVFCSHTRPGQTDLLRQVPYDLIILDLDVKGHEPANIMKKLQRYWSKIPLLLITNDRLYETARVPKNFCVVGVVQKPFSPESLYDEVGKALAAKPSTR